MTRSFVVRSLASAIAAAGLGVACAQAQTVFSYPNFSSTTGLVLNGVTVQTGPTLSITPPVRAASGSVWHQSRVPVAGIWLSTFEFRIRDVTGSGADGFAFVIQNSADQTAALGSPGGALGYAENPVFPNLPGIANSLAVEFDLWNNNGDWNDFNSDQHISVQCRGVLQNSPDGQYSLGSILAGPDLSDGMIHTGQVQYVNGVLNVYVDLAQVLSVNVDLSTELMLDAGQALVGFSASTGSTLNVQRHELLSWDFNVVPNPTSAVVLGVGGLGLLVLRPSRGRR